MTMTRFVSIALTTCFLVAGGCAAEDDSDGTASVTAGSTTTAGSDGSTSAGSASGDATSSGAASASGGASSDTNDPTAASAGSGGAECPSRGDPCVDCVAEVCCSELNACLDEEPCACVVACADEGTDLETCGTDCDVLSDPPETLMAYIECISDAACDDVCPG